MGLALLPDGAGISTIIFCETTSTGTYTTMDADAAARPDKLPTVAAATLSAPSRRAAASAGPRTPSRAKMYEARAGMAPRSTGPNPANRPRTPELPTIARSCSNLERPTKCDAACALVFMTFRGCITVVMPEYRPDPMRSRRGRSRSVVSSSIMGVSTHNFRDVANISRPVSVYRPRVLYSKGWCNRASVAGCLGY